MIYGIWIYPVEKIWKDVPPRVLKSRIHDGHLAEIAQDLVDWEQISPVLNLTESECKEIKEDFSDRYNLQKRQALRVWRCKSGDQATYERLMELFCSQGLVDLAEMLAKYACTDKQRSRSNLVIDTFHRYLLDCYLQLPHPSRKQWPSNFQVFLPRAPYVYIDLTLSTIALNSIEEIVRAGREISSKTCQSSLTTNLRDVFSSDEQLVLLFEGVAGSGKTTLSWHACREWAGSRLLPQFHLLIHVQVKDPQLHEAKHLPDLIPYPDEKLRVEVASAIIDQKGKGICFLLDGLDEAPTSLLELLLKILFATQIPQLSLIMTSRPDSRVTKGMQAILKSRIIIEGFSKAKLYEFLDVTLGADSNEKQRLVQKFKINPQLESLCGLPINAVIMIFLNHFFHQDTPSTQTGLFKPLLSHFLVRHVQTRTSEDELPEIKNFADDIPPDVRKPFRQICKLAYTYSTSSQKKKLFTSEELFGANVSIDNSLGLLQVHPKVTMYGQKRYYSFPHLSIQEFLAAVHVSRRKLSEQTKAIKLVMKQDPLSHILPFYAGLTHIRDNQEAVQVLSEVLKLPVEDSTTVAALKENFSLANDRRRQALTLFNCLYESQDEGLFECHQVQLASDVLSLLGLGLTPTDCIAVAYFIRMSLVQKMRMLTHRMGRCSEVGMSSFVKELRSSVCTSTLPCLRLEISDVIFTKAAIQSLKYLLQGRSVVQALHVLCYLDPTNANAAILLKYLIEGLSLDPSCNEIGLGFFDLCDSHVYHLILLVRGCPRLVGFHLSFDVDLRRIMPLFSAALKYSTLKILVLTRCKINDRALQYLGNGICENQHLSLLMLMNNSFTEKGLLSFLKLFINKKSVLQHVRVDSKIYYSLKEMTEYSHVISQINRIRRMYSKNPFFVVEHGEATAIKYLQSMAAQVVELPAPFSRRHVL